MFIKSSTVSRRLTAPCCGKAARRSEVACRKILMMNTDRERINTIHQKLRELDAEFDREMRTRGFDPAQAENVALPSHLAALYAEREQIKAALEESEEKTDDGD
jgi:hypothetical protein